MIKIVYDDQPGLLAWAAKRIGLSGFKSDAKAFGVTSNGVLRAVVAYDNFMEADVAMHVASEGDGHWLTRRVLLQAFGYPFIDLNLRRVTALIPMKKTAAIRFNEHLGFKLEGLCPEAMPDDDIQIRGMLRRECRFIPPEYRQ
jgi:L-amino acid N-acyltransferase YncA